MPAVENVAIHKSKVAYANTNTASTLPVIRLVDSGGLSLLKTVGIKAMIKIQEPIEKIISCQFM